jgi:hypothetical protein
MKTGPASNPDTLVSVHGYSGDSHQIRNAMVYYKHHKCPVVVLSPDDSPINEKNCGRWSGVEYRTGGKRAYIGQLSLDRQIEHFKILLEYPHKFFLMNDSDSVCLSPQLPDYLYERPDVLWSNVVSDAMHDHKRAPDYPWPHLAFQPPYFCSREVIERLLTVAEEVKADVNTPFIDWAMMAWCVKSGAPYGNFLNFDGVSCPTVTAGAGGQSIYEPGCSLMANQVWHHKAIFLHSIKTLDVLKRMGYARLACKRKFRL